jgi:hypothetical protein
LRGNTAVAAAAEMAAAAAAAAAGMATCGRQINCNTVDSEVADSATKRHG